MDHDISLHYDPIEAHLFSLFEKANYSYENFNYSREEEALIDDSFEQIKKMNRLRKYLLAVGISDSRLDNIEMVFIDNLYRFINYKEMELTHSLYEPLRRLMFRISTAAALVTIAIILAILIFLPITPLITVLLSIVIASTLVLYYINKLFLYDESAPLSNIKHRIASSIFQLEYLIKTSKDQTEYIELLERARQESDESIVLNDTGNASMGSIENDTFYERAALIESEINPNKSVPSNEHDTSFESTSSIENDNSSPPSQRSQRLSQRRNLSCTSLQSLEAASNPIATGHSVRSSSWPPRSRIPLFPALSSTEAINDNETNDCPLQTSTP